ncbi:maleylpyruvate isomerase N-terminal domain-containing protein [Nocardioides cynanchi]|uniref:maleylpyruvate isomerase N-terminal domain-containing protein n=1 Tax=Nocardioides cynanchi TaxID=2558918 RepID=UPI001248E126|nr:maleylpyruvate isomerase N-terminal domain-containing protein [Nocardioides cynanchi]
MNDSRHAYLSSLESFVAQVGSVPVAELTCPGLGDWDLRSLVGHTSRSLVTVETYLDQPAEVVEVPTAADYYLQIAATGAASGDAVVERGRVAGAALGDDPARFVRDLATRVRIKLEGYDATYALSTIAGGMLLGEYLRTRTFELVVHGLDIGRACGVRPALGEDALLDAAGLAAEVAVRSGKGPDLLVALTGRGALPTGFTVV